MKENRLGILLKVFKDEDWKAYQKFAKSRYSDDSDHKAIIDHIKKHKARLDPKKLDSETLRIKIRPQAKPIVFANVISKLCKHIEAYFVYAEVKNDPMMEDTLLLQAFANRGLTDQFHKQKKKAKVSRDKQPLGLWKHYHDFIAEYLDYYKLMTTGIPETRKILERGNKSLTDFSEVLQGYLGVEMNNRNVLLEEKWIINEYKCVEFEQIFYLLNNLNLKREWYLYFRLNKALTNNNYSIQIQYTIISYLSSFLKTRLANNDDNAGSELVSLFTYGLKKGILFPNKMMPIGSFTTIINIGSKTGNYNWAEKIIDKYSNQVIGKNTHQIKIYGHAYLAFKKGDYQKTIELLRATKMDQFSLEIKSKLLLLLSQYELNPHHTESLKYYSTSFKSYIKRNRKKETITGSNVLLTTLKFFDRLLSKKRLEELEVDVKNENKMGLKPWFVKKIKEMLENSSTS